MVFKHHMQIWSQGCFDTVGEAERPNLLRGPLYAHGFLSYSSFLMNTRIFDLKIIKFGVDISHQKSEIKA